MRSCSRGASLRPTSFQYDNRLLQRYLARGGKEVTDGRDRLHIKENARGLRVVTEVIDELAPADVGHRACGDDRRKAHVAASAPIQYRRQQRATLRYQCDIAWASFSRNERRRQPDRGPNHTERIWAKEAHSACGSLDLLF